MDIHDLLNSFIDDGWEEPAKVLYSMWDDQQKAITYKELKEAIRNGSLTVSDYMAWQQDYINWLNGPYAETVERAVEFAHKALVDQYGGVLNIPSLAKIDEYISNHGGRLIREVSEGQFRAINTLVRQAMMTETLTVDELARCIRPCIGLTERQAAQTRKFYEQLREDGYSKSAALKKQQAFAEKLHRDRAKLIAQTEMAYAANYGMDATVRQNIEDGLISPDVDKEWSTARDERVCPICGSLHGETVKEDETFSNGDELPPAHPSCRCAVKYHMKAAEKPAHTEEPNRLSHEGQDDIISDEEYVRGSTSNGTREALDGVDSKGYHHPLTQEIQDCQTPEELAKLFEVDGVTIFDPETAGKLPLDVQKEIAEGVRWSMDTYKLSELPSQINTNMVSPNAIGEYSDTYREVRFRSTISVGKAFPTAVHEMTHHAILLKGIDPDRIEDEAWRMFNDEREKLGERKLTRKNKDYLNARGFLVGKSNNDCHEMTTGAMERYCIGKLSDFWPIPAFPKLIAQLFLGRVRE